MPLKTPLETKIETATLWTTTLMARIAGFAILITAILIFVEVVVRKLAGISIIGADEISGYVLAISVSWGISLALVRRAHVRIDIIYTALPRWVGAIFDIVSILALLAFGGLLAWYASKLLSTNVKVGAISNTVMEVPLAIPQAFWVFGLWVFVVVCLILIGLSVRALLHGDIARVQSLVGVRAATDEAREEAEMLKITATRD